MATSGGSDDRTATPGADNSQQISAWNQNGRYAFRESPIGHRNGRQRSGAEYLPMCDYSLHAVASRPAEAGDRLISTAFPRTVTRGFAAECDRTVAVCLLPGTELGFDQEVRFRRWFWPQTTGFSVACFRKLSSNSNEHQDALEFPDGKVILLTHLIPGQRARVIQLPATLKAHAPKVTARNELLTNEGSPR
jgi:hypothetical protein